MKHKKPKNKSNIESGLVYMKITINSIYGSMAGSGIFYHKKHKQPKNKGIYILKYN